MLHWYISDMNTAKKLLQYFKKHPGQTLSRWDIYRAVWGNHLGVQSRTLDVHVSKLREAGHTIETVHGIGYYYKPKAENK